MQLKKINFTNVERSLLILTSLAIVFCFHSVWYTKKSAQIKSLKKQIVQNKVSIDAKKIIISKLKSKEVKQLKIDFKPYEKKIQYAINSKTSFSDYIKTLDLQSQDEGIIINRVSTESDVVEELFQKRLFKIEIESSFVNIGKFIEKLDNSRYLTQIKSIDVKRISDDLKICRVEIKVFAYQLKTGGKHVAAK